jgi:predicted transposase YbfD/YdcC
MDCLFRDDACKIRGQNAPAHFTPIKHKAPNLLHRRPAQKSLTSKKPKGPAGATISSKV